MLTYTQMKCLVNRIESGKMDFKGVIVELLEQGLVDAEDVYNVSSLSAGVEINGMHLSYENYEKYCVLNREEKFINSIKEMRTDYPVLGLKEAKDINDEIKRRVLAEPI